MITSIAWPCLVLPGFILPPTALRAETLDTSANRIQVEEATTTVLDAPAEPSTAEPLKAHIARAVRSADATTPVPEAQQSLGKAARKHYGAGRGALVGLVLGAATGAVLGLSSGDDIPRPCHPPRDPSPLVFLYCLDFRYTAGQKALAGGAALGVVGAATGAILGAALPYHPRRTVVSRRVGFRIGGSPRAGLTATASLAF